MYKRQVHGGSPQNDHSEGLIGPAEITPDDGVVDLAEGVADVYKRQHIDHSFAHALSLSAQRKVMRGKICRVDFSQQITLAESRLSSYNGYELSLIHIYPHFYGSAFQMYIPSDRLLPS